MKTLVFADRPPSRPISEILAENPDIELIITLWDLYFYDIQELANVTNIPKIGVYGNHCDGRYMETLGIINLHLKTFEYKGVSFMWYEGCVKYKESTMMSTQEFCSRALSSAPKVDVFISHCPPRWVNDNDDPAHYGFDGIREYIDRNHPRYLLHGHTYDFGKFVTKHEETVIRYVEREKIVEL